MICGIELGGSQKALKLLKRCPNSVISSTLGGLGSSILKAERLDDLLPVLEGKAFSHIITPRDFATALIMVSME